jgi:hypothetical protein
MNNFFLKNSRFDCLIDDKVIYKKNNESENTNSFKSEKKGYFKKDKFQEREEKNKYKKELEEKKIQESLHIDNFPELNSNKKHLVKEEKHGIQFVDLLKNKNHNKKMEYLDTDLNDLKPGNILIKMDPNTRKIVVKTNPKDKNILKENEYIKTEKELAYESIDNVVKLHEKRTNDYIELYGYDTWEKMFQFPNWEANFSEPDSEEEEVEYEVEEEKWHEEEDSI